MQPFNHLTIRLTKIFCLFLLASCFLLFAFYHPTFAQPQALPTSAVAEAQGVVEIQALETVFGNILAIATSLAGFAAFVVLIAGGFKWMTSGGDPKKMEAAKGSVTYAFVGLACLILIWFILLFLEQFTGVKLTIFKLPV